MRYIFCNIFTRTFVLEVDCNTVDGILFCNICTRISALGLTGHGTVE